MTKKKSNMYTPPLMVTVKISCHHALMDTSGWNYNALNESINNIDNEYEWN